ncbi:MAG: glycosyltransferase family 1 protein [Patescibacteria group bacterium]|jgi:glycosyltransferase involved in cell wall biosynthesis
MKIGIDCRTILNPKGGEGAGVGHYTYYLVQSLSQHDPKNSYVLFFDRRLPDISTFTRPNVEVKYFPFSQYNRFLPFAYSHMLITAFLMKEGLDIFHSPITSVPLTYPKKTVVTVHDLAIYKNPDWFPSQIFSTKLLVPRSLKTADRVIAVSESTKHDLQEIFNVPSRKIKVIYEGVDVKKILLKSKKIDSVSSFKIGKKYILFVGTMEPRKNLVTLVRAYKKLIQPGSGFAGYELVIAGAKGYKHEDIFAEIKSLGLSKNVKYVGYVTHNQKVELIKRAACFVFPSSYEGFGLPILEAMALGTPVATSNISSLPEIAGKAALLFDPEKEQTITHALRKILGDKKLHEKLSQAGIERANKFSWERCARETAKVYESLGSK